MKKYSRSKQYDETVLKKLHGVQVEMLHDFAQVCEKYELPYFAVYGTAIGAVRHAGFIPWDDDIDVGMLRVDYDKFMENQNMKSLMDVYNSRLANCGTQVRVLSPGNEYTGMALGIDEMGELLVRTEDGKVCKVISGEVSVRGIYGYV
mgnify:CR=1 FL=1